MESSKNSDGTSKVCTIKSEVDGETEITITKTKHENIGRGGSPLKCYTGVVKSGTTGSQPVRATVFAIRSAGAAREIAEILHTNCTTFDHPYVMRSLGYARGTPDFSSYMFVAFPAFYYTFNDFRRPASQATEFGRLSEIFIEAVSQIVKGLQALHDNNFCCPNLEGKDIALEIVNGHATAKIWNFSVCNSEREKNMGWKKLGYLIYSVTHGPDSLEISDLYKKIANSHLKGLNILRHCALFSVREKFEKVLSLWMHVSIKCKPKLVQPLEASKLTYTLEEYLDLRSIESKRPPWIDNKRRTPSPKTLRQLLDEIRDMIQHEIEYIPQEMMTDFTFKDIEEGKKKYDLESCIRHTWTEEFLMVQLWACDPTAELEKKVNIKACTTKNRRKT